MNLHLPHTGLCLLLALVGCAESSMELGAAENDTYDFAGDVPALALRIDVHADSGTESKLLDQSFIFPDGVSEDLQLELSTPISFSGQMTGFATNPTTSCIGLPGDAGGVEGVVRVGIPNTVMGYAVATDDEGYFSMLVVPSSGYNIGWIPDFPTDLPFHVALGQTLEADVDEEVYLDRSASQAVYGLLQDANGNPLSGVQVQAIERNSGIGGAVVESDAQGAYHLRVYPGSYDIHFWGNPDDAIPDFKRALEVVDGATDADAMTPLVVVVEDATVSGQVYGSDGMRAGSVLVRLTSQELFDNDTGELTAESTTGSNGRFSIRVLPGLYTVEYITDANSSNSPYLAPGSLTILSGNTEIEVVDLPERPTVEGQVLDVDGRPLGQALVQAEELGFNGSTFETYTQEDGSFQLEVSETEMKWTLIPVNPVSGAITFFLGEPREVEGEAFMLAKGESLSGCVEYKGAPVSFVLVEARDTTGELHAATLTDMDGCFGVRVDWPEGEESEDSDTGGGDTAATRDSRYFLR